MSPAGCRFLATLSACAFLVGAFRNESGERRPKEDVTTYYRCTVLVAGVFTGATFFCLVAAAVGIASYIALEAAASSGGQLQRPPLWWDGKSSGRAPRWGSRSPSITRLVRRLVLRVDRPRLMQELFEDDV